MIDENACSFGQSLLPSHTLILSVWQSSQASYQA